VIDPAANPEERLADDRRRERLRSVLRAIPERDASVCACAPKVCAIAASRERADLAGSASR
jgi:hypothetical protein